VITLEGNNENSLNLFVTGGSTRRIFTSTGTGEFRIIGSNASGVAKLSVTAGSAGSNLLFDDNVLVTTTVGVNFGLAGITTVNSIFQIEPNGYVITNSPNYGTSSTLIYNNGINGYKRNMEWNTDVAGLFRTGYPQNIIVKGNTPVELNATGFAAPNGLGCSGNFTIESGSSVTTIAQTTPFAAMAFPISILGNLTIDGPLTLSTNVAGLLNVGGSWSRTGTFVQNDRMVTFNGTNTATITATGGQLFSFMTLNKGTKATSLSLNDNVSISDEITFTQGTFDLAAKNVTIISTALKTARVGQSSSANTVFPYSGIGRFIIERNVAALRSWRLLTAPITSTQTIRNAWMEGATPSTTTPSLTNDIPVANYGTHVTGPSPSVNDFDQSPLNNHSVKYLSGNNWVGIANTAVDIISQKGFMVFIRGDRAFPIDITTSGTSATTTTLRTTGRINIGDMSPITTSGLTVIGNPYPSAINFSSLTKSPSARTNDIYSIWDPKRPSGNTSTTVGGWVTMTRAGAGTNYIPSVALSSSTIDITTGRIESGAAIVVSDVNLATVTIKESDKTNENALVFRPLGDQFSINKMLRTTLYLKNADSSLSVFDGALHMFDESYSKDVDGMDAVKLANFNENFGISSQSKILSIEKRLPLSENDTICYNMAQMRVKNYTLELDPLNIEQNNLVGFIEDNYLKTLTSINMDAKTQLDFDIINEPGSYAANRFRLVFKKLIDYTSLKATPVGSNVLVDWKVASEFNISRYEIERSTNGADFSSMGNVNSAGNNSNPIGYNWIDPSLTPGVYYYRIKCISNNNVVAYSNVEKIKLMKSNPTIYIAPNPVTDNIIHLQMNTVTAGRYTLRLLNNAGQVMQTRTINHTGTNTLHTWALNQYVTKGTYQVELTAAGKKTMMLQVLIQ